jgi:MFS family permease
MTSFNFAGLALGTILAGLLVQYEPHPLHLPFAMYLVVLAATLVAVMRTRETLDVQRQSRVSLKPRLGVPTGVRLAFVSPAAGGFAAMAMVGFFAALGPTTLHDALHVTNRAVSGMVVSELFIAAAVVIIMTRSLQPRTTMMIGLVTIPFGVALLVAAQQSGSLPLMLLSAGVCGASSALGYRGGLAVVNALTPAERRAEVASTYFVCCFLGNALPIIGVAALSKIAGANLASVVFAGVLSLIGIGALAAAVLFKRAIAGS